MAYQHVSGCEVPLVCSLQLPDDELAVVTAGDHGPLVPQQVDTGDTVARAGLAPHDQRHHQVSAARHPGWSGLLAGVTITTLKYKYFFKLLLLS